MGFLVGAGELEQIDICEPLTKMQFFEEIQRRHVPFFNPFIFIKKSGLDIFLTV
jgi:hypothetical protein